MAENNKSKLLFGIIFVLIAFGCLGYLFYFLNASNQENLRKIVELQVRLTDSITEKASTQMNPSDVKRATGTPVLLEDLVKKAEEVYGEDEKNQKEGFLWVDKEANSFMVTLGALNGLSQGSKLSVYDNDQKIDEVIVETPFDVISYVKPQKPAAEYALNYYRVVIE